MQESDLIHELLQEPILGGRNVLHRPRRLFELFQRLLQTINSKLRIGALLAICDGYSDDRDG